MDSQKALMLYTRIKSFYKFFDIDQKQFIEEMSKYNYDDVKENFDLYKDYNDKTPTFNKLIKGLGDGEITEKLKGAMCDCRYCKEWFDYRIIRQHEQQCTHKETIWHMLANSIDRPLKRQLKSDAEKLALLDLVIKENKKDEFYQKALLLRNVIKGENVTFEEVLRTTKI